MKKRKVRIKKLKKINKFNKIKSNEIMGLKKKRIEFKILIFKYITVIKKHANLSFIKFLKYKNLLNY